ncbi:hypothetical protein EV193_101932 [Herbihabitans rhizosphaerae]|uniref:Uncharacterized protein n=1 Tax=Herbihabitans rhizosphaerae TaxID=1872711 RepID=A0A4Q7L5W2_9PSEU|nr:hypothetical protein [Herbihabitans rhizosphaerae]RZS45048.1 hypothetical protein EV193_101932 [Herbihabitans rhizosphaerae]
MKWDAYEIDTSDLIDATPIFDDVVEELRGGDGAADATAPDGGRRPPSGARSHDHAPVS